MRTIKLATAYQLVLTSLLLGACLGTVSQRVPETLHVSVPGVQAKTVAEQHAAPDLQNQTIGYSLPTDLALTANQDAEANVQVEVEVHTTRGANASARAIGPGDTEVKTDTIGEGHGRAIARLDAPTSPAWPAAAQSVPAASAASNAANVTASSNDVGFVVVKEGLVNLRNAPGLYGAVVGSAARGQEMKIIGREGTGNWWLVCCVNDQAVWIAAPLVATKGSTADIHIVNTSSPLPASATSHVGATNPLSADSSSTTNVDRDATIRAAIQPTVVPSYRFTLAEQKQHGEQITPRIYLYVHDRDEGLGDYTVRVQKDGATLPVNGRTFAGTPGYSWPLPHERQHFTNLKLEFPNVSAGGKWEIQLIDGAGNPVGPVAYFTLAPNDLNQEMYLRYEQR